MLAIEDLHFRLGPTSILNGVSLSVREGEKVGIIGPNGSGKTTLFNCISGFNSPCGGKVTFKGIDVTYLPAHRKAVLGLGRVFQNFGVFKEMTVLENIVAALEGKELRFVLPFSLRYKECVEKADEYLRMVSLESRGMEKAGSLSGGQMRLLEIARAIASGATVLLLDEPTAGVSPKMKAEVEQVLAKLGELRKTVLVIEHDLNFIQRLCERIVVLDSGRVVLDDTPEQVRVSPILHEIYFGATDRQDGRLKLAAGE